MTRAPDSRPALATGYRIEPFVTQRAVSGRDLISLWTSQAGLSREEAERRVDEVLLVATDAGGGLAAMGTAYLKRNQQLRAEVWYYRTFVAEAHRRSNVAASLAVAARDHLTERFVAGEDRRAIGIVYVIQSQLLMQFVPQAEWPQTKFLYIGETDRGSHVRVHYFPGALAPDPD